MWLALVVRNDWSAVPVLFGLVVFGIGQGALVTLLFNVLVTASPKELAGDVGSLRGTTNNLAAAVGTAVAGALLVGLLSSIMLTAINASPKLTPELQAQVDLDSINFVSNDRLQETLAKTTASPAQVAEAVRVNTESRLRALKIGLLHHGGRRNACDFPGRLAAELSSRAKFRILRQAADARTANSVDSNWLHALGVKDAWGDREDARARVASPSLRLLAASVRRLSRGARTMQRSIRVRLFKIRF